MWLSKPDYCLNIDQCVLGVYIEIFFCFYMSQILKLFSYPVPFIPGLLSYGFYPRSMFLFYKSLLKTQHHTFLGACGCYFKPYRGMAENFPDFAPTWSIDQYPKTSTSDLLEGFCLIFQV